MNKAIQALLTGMFITFILDFFLFLGILLNYINYYKIDVYYNILFADHQNIYIYFISSIILGYIVIYVKGHKSSLIAVGVLFFLVCLTLIESIGNSVGESMLMTKNITLKSKKQTFIGDIYYDGRKKITFYDYELKKVILLNKKDLIK